MNPAVTWVIAIAVTIFHIWASRRKPKYWYLGGVVPVIWIGIIIFLFANGMIHKADDWEVLFFPTVILLLIWLSGHESAKKKEMESMKAQDI